MAARLSNATLRIYADSGQGGVFPHHREFVPEVRSFFALVRTG
jgi:hypothetical protein